MGVRSSTRAENWMQTLPLSRVRALTPIGGLALTICGCHRDPRPGCAPGGAVPFFCMAKRKAPKKRPPQLSAPSAGATGTCGARFGRGLAKLACAQTDASPDPPKAVLLGAYRWGPRGAGSARLRRASRLRRELGVAFGLVHIGNVAAFVHFRFLGPFSGAKKAVSAYGMGASSSCFLLPKEKHL